MSFTQKIRKFINKKMNQLLQETNTVKVSLTAQNRQESRELTAIIKDISSRKQVYLNCLATRAVFNYFTSLNIKAEFPNVLILDALTIKTDVLKSSKGYFRCLTTRENETVLNLPSDYDPNFIGYIVVEFQAKVDTVEIIGFVPACTQRTKIAKTLISNLEEIQNKA